LMCYAALQTKRLEHVYSNTACPDFWNRFWTLWLLDSGK
jgi:hypothetical protein